jgi:DNA (cytosine-5)-methyltransferase 1
VTYSFLDLFSGAGGFTLGLEAAGALADSVAVDADPDCAETFRSNFPQATMIESDVRDVDYSAYSVDVVVAGPPCQGFSLLNRRRDGDERRVLWTEVVRAVEVLRPTIAVVENVASFADSEESRELGLVLEARGYSVRMGVVNAADYGVPQRRLRSLLTAAAAGWSPPWPAATHSASARDLPAHRTVAEAFSLLPTRPSGREWHRDDYRARSPQIERLRSIREGGARRDLPVDLVLDCWKDAGGFSDVLGRLEWSRPATTVRTEFFRPEKGRFLHPSEDRPITPREAARLQSFPDSFVFPEHHKLYSVGRQIGNAMPPRLARAIGSAISGSLGSRTRRKRGRRTPVQTPARAA